MAGDRQERVLQGVAVSDGYAVARVCLLNEKRHNNLPQYKVQGEGIDRELARLAGALTIGRSRLERIEEDVRARIGRAEAEIFVAQRMILDDESMQAKIRARIGGDGLNAETAIAQVLDGYESRLQEMDNEYIRERASDIGEIKRRLLDVLGNMKPELQCDEARCQKGRNRIIVAEELTPALTVELDTGRVMGFVSERGGANSHAAILARALGIPAVSGIAGIRDQLCCGTEVLLNGGTGEVVLNPSERTVERMRHREPVSMRMPDPVDPVAGLRVQANVSTMRDVAEAVAMRAEGIGLYRTEIEFITAGRVLDEEEMYTRYVGVRKAAKGLPLVFRMLDVGSDKPLFSLAIPREDNPALGLRGARLLLDKPELMRGQARALARLSMDGPVQVMYPMVIDEGQFAALKEAFLRAVDGLPLGRILHGAMFETPSACLAAEEIFRLADFGSLGTNDLIQYTFAVDRNNSLVAADRCVDKAVLWRLIDMVVVSARQAGKPLTVCGELAGEPDLLKRLLAVGVSTVSVSPRKISGLRVAAELVTADL